MKFEIKHRFSGNVLLSMDTDSVKPCVEEAVKIKANLSWADLNGADLNGADLSKANLSWADLSRANLNGAKAALGAIERWC